MTLDLQLAQSIDPGGAISSGFDASKMDANMRAVFASEASSNQPSLPPQVQLDIAMAGGNAGDVTRFMAGVNKALDDKWTSYEAPDPASLSPVYGDPTDLGYMSRGGMTASYQPSLERYKIPAPGQISGRHGMTGEFTRAISGFLGGGLAVKGVDAVLSQYMPGGLAGGADATRWTDASPNVYDPQAVSTFQRQAVQFGLLPKTTRIDGQWKPGYSSLLYEMGNKDFSAALRGDRFGAMDPFAPSKLELLNELLSPQFALMFVKELGSSVVYDHWWTGERVNNAATDFRREWTDFKEATNVWDKFTSAAGMLLAPADDILMPVFNIALMFFGVGEVILGAKLAKSGGMAAVRTGGAMLDTVRAVDTAMDVGRIGNRAVEGVKAVDRTAGAISSGRASAGAFKFSRGAIDAEVTAARVAGRSRIFELPGSRLLRGYDSVGRLEELQKFTREPGRMMSAWNARGGPVGTKAYRALDGWRQQKAAFVVKKSTQQLMRYSQAKMGMGALGDDSAIAARDRARDRYWEWTFENPVLSSFVALAEAAVMPQNIYPVGFFKSQSKWASNASNALRRTNLPDAMVQAMVADAENSGNVALAAKIREALDSASGNPGQVLIKVLGSEEQATTMLYSAIIHAGVEVRVGEEIATRSLTFRDAAHQTAVRLKLRNKFLAQMNKWNHEDPSDALRFIENMYGSNSDEYIRYSSYLNDANPQSNPYYNDLQFWMKQSNKTRNTELAYYVDMIAKDPAILSKFLEKNPTYFQPEAWERLMLSAEGTSNWLNKLPADEAAALGKQVGIDEVLKAREARRTMPSILKIFDPVTGNQELRARAGMSGIVKDMQGWLTGKRPYGLTSQHNLNANPLSQLDVIDSPNAGRFTPAKLDTVTRQDADTFLDTVDLLVERRRAVQELLDAANAAGVDIGSELVSGMARNGRGVRLSDLDEAQYKAFIDMLVTPEGKGTRKVQSVIGGRVKTRTVKLAGRKTKLSSMSSAQKNRLKSDRVRRLLQHMEVAGDLNLNPQTLLDELDDTMARIVSDSGVWTDTFSVGVNDLRKPSARSVSDHLETIARKSRDRARWFAAEVDVATFDPALADELARNGHKLVYGQEFWEQFAIVEGLSLPTGIMQDASIAATKQLPFLPDAVAESVLIQKMARPAAKFGAWAMYPGEKMFIPIFTRRLQQETSRALMAAFDRDASSFKKFNITDKADLAPNSDLVNTVIRSHQSRLSKLQMNAQTGKDSSLGIVSRTASRMSHSVVPRTLVDPASRKLTSAGLLFEDARFVKNGKFLPFTDVFDDKTLDGLAKAMRLAQDISDAGRDMSTAMKVRGPTLIARDWIETNGLARGALSGAGLFLFGGTTARAAVEQQARLGGFLSKAKGSVGRGLIGAGATAAYGAVQNYQDSGNPFAEVDLQTIGLAGFGSAVGGMAGFVGAAMGSQAGIETGVLGALGGAAISRKGLSLPSRIGRVAGVRSVDTGEGVTRVAGALGQNQDFSRISTGLSSQTGAITAGLLGTEGGDEQSSVLQRMGAAAAGAAIGPTLMRSIGDVATGMKIWNSSMTERTLNLSMALRFTLSPLFDMQRHLELSSMAITKSPEGFAVPLVPLGKRAFIKKYGQEVWSEQARMYDEAAAAVHGKGRVQFASADETARHFQDEGILGFNPTEKSISIMTELVEQGMEPVEAYKAARAVTTYGTDGRKTGELVANSLFFPLSFQARYIGRGIKWMADDAARGLLISDSLLTYQYLEEAYNLDDVLRDYLPLAKSLQKLNGLAMGVSLGEFGGIDRPWINLFIPVLARAYRTVEGNLALSSPSDAYGQASEMEPIQLTKLINRLVPAWRDVKFLVDDAKDQWEVVASKNHMTTDNQRKTAMARWSALQTNADMIAQSNGFRTYTDFVRSGRPGAEKLGRNMKMTQLKLEREYPLWAEGRDESVVRWTANQRVLKRRAGDAKIPVDREIAKMMFFLDRLRAENPPDKTFIDWADSDTIPVSIQNEIRSYAISLAQQGHGFEQIWDKYFRTTYGPIRRPVFQTIEAQDRSILKQRR